MALSVRKVANYVTGDRRTVVADVTFDSSYATGGLALTPSQFGLTDLTRVSVDPSMGGHVCPYDYTNQKLLAFNGTTEISARTDLSRVTVRATAVGQTYGI